MANDKLTASQILLPVFLLSAAFATFLAYQTTLLVNERDSLKQAYAQQEEPLGQIDKLKKQLTALATGTLKLAKEGDKDATNIIDALKKAGINVEDQPPAAANATSPAVTPTMDKAKTP